MYLNSARIVTYCCVLCTKWKQLLKRRRYISYILTDMLDTLHQLYTSNNSVFLHYFPSLRAQFNSSLRTEQCKWSNLMWLSIMFSYRHYKSIHILAERSIPHVNLHSLRNKCLQEQYWSSKLIMTHCHDRRIWVYNVVSYYSYKWPLSCVTFTKYIKM